MEITNVTVKDPAAAQDQRSQQTQPHSDEPKPSGPSNPSGGMRRAIISSVAILLMLVVVALLWVRSRSKANVEPTVAPNVESPSNPNEVVIEPGQKQDIKFEAAALRSFSTEKNATGKIAFNDNLVTPVFSIYTGRVVRLIAKPGDVVKLGDPLFEIDTPDVVQAEQDLTTAITGVAKAKTVLDFDVAGEYQREGGENTFGVTVSIPIFIHNNHLGDIEQALAQVQQTKAQFDQVKLQAMTDIDKAFRGYEISKQLMAIYTTEAISKAEQSFQIAGVSYKEGATSLLELKDAQRTYNQTRVAFNQAHFNYRLSIYQLEMATGKKVM
jgi:multidrug efflux pump subunit AcrA (membrane-fusion protein)